MTSMPAIPEKRVALLIVGCQAVARTQQRGRGGQGGPQGEGGVPVVGPGGDPPCGLGGLAVPQVRAGPGHGEHRGQRMRPKSGSTAS